MIIKNRWLALVAAIQFTAATASLVAAPKSYQVTGPILELTDSTIVVDKNGERWEISRDASTKVQGDLKVGAKVTVYYRMTATSVETKETAAKGAKKK